MKPDPGFSTCCLVGGESSALSSSREKVHFCMRLFLVFVLCGVLAVPLLYSGALSQLFSSACGGFFLVFTVFLWGKRALRPY